ncbi:MAG TPA: peptidylprolyl isomerase, partial [Terriglobales bacterium]|nr:peptidylprolyl isomerase [Terriglobales bacterium]
MPKPLRPAVVLILALFCGLLACTESKPPAESTAAPAAASIPLPEHATAILDTTQGAIVCRLFEKDAPKTVQNFTELAEGKREWTHPATR